MKLPSALQQFSSKKVSKHDTQVNHAEVGESDRHFKPNYQTGSRRDSITFSRPFSKRDSGYITATSRAPSENAIPPAEMIPNLPTRHMFSKRPVVLKRYHLAVTESCRRRFLDLKPLLEEALSDYLRRKNLQCQSSSMNLMFLGEDAASAKLYLLITCDKARVGPIRFFFNQGWVREEMKPDKKLGFPHFELHISPHPPQPASGTSVYVYGNNSREQAHWDSLGGVSIAVQGEKGIRAAKLGGTIQCISTNGDIFVRGLTVGHVIAPWRMAPKAEMQEKEEHKTSHLMPDMSVDDFSQYEEDDDNVRLDTLPSFKENYDLVRKNQHDDDWKIAHVYIGCTCEAPQVDESGRNLDYALVVMDGRTRYRPTHRPSASYFKPWTSGSSISGLGRPVMLLNHDMDGGWIKHNHGRLAQVKSSLLLAPGFRYANTYRLEMDIGCKISYGDCGSWVVDRENGEVYGQLVATDSFDDAHVIPISDILQDIKQRLGLAAVVLTVESEALQLMLYEGNSNPNNNSKRHLDFQPLSGLPQRASRESGMTLTKEANSKAHQSPVAKSVGHIKKHELFRHVLWKWRQSRSDRIPTWSPSFPQIPSEKLQLFKEDMDFLTYPDLSSLDVISPFRATLKPNVDPVDILYPTHD